MVLVTALCLVAALVGAPSDRAAAAADEPGAARGGVAPFRGAMPEASDANAAPVVRASEDFENGLSTTPVMLDRYVGRSGQRYTADPRWIDPQQCNGILTSQTSGDVAACSANPQLRTLATVLGTVTGTDPRSNHAVSAWTLDRRMPADAVQVQPTSSTPLGETGRFVSFGVAAAAASCDVAHPELAFSLVDRGEERPVSGPIDPCTDRRAQTYTVGGEQIRAGSFISPGGLLFDGDTVQWRLRNQQTAFDGNDGAIDGVSVLDTTPRLANAFAGTPVVGDTARMTARVVNTSELGSKPGWSYAERLPSGLRIAEAPHLESSCTGGAVSAEPGGDLLTVHGDLATDAVDCAVSFDVTSDRAGTYTLTAGAVEAHRGIDLPDPASVTFLPEQNALVAAEEPVLTGDDAVADLGEEIAFATTVRNAGNAPVHDLGVVGTAGTSTCAATDLDPGASTVCTSPRRPVVQADLDRGRIDDAVRATATARSGDPVEATASATAPTPAAAPGVAGVLSAHWNDHEPHPGDAVTLALRVANTGNVTLHDLAAAVDGRDEFTVTCPATPLAPGADEDCRVSGSARLTQQEIDGGALTFTAPVTAHAPDGTAVRTDTAAEVPLLRRDAVAADATAAIVPGAGTVPLAGYEVRLGLVLRNTGNTTLHDPTALADDRPDLDVDCPTGDLAPGATVTCTVGSHHLSQADVDAGRLDVAFTARGTGPDGQSAETHAVTGVDVERLPVLGATLTAHLATVDAGDSVGSVAAGTDDRLARPGDHVEVAVEIRNAGNVTLHDLAAELVESVDAPVTCPIATLAPGGTVSCTVPDHELTQDDVERGVVPFVLTASATDPTGVAVDARDDVRVGLRAGNVLDLRTTVVERARDGAVRPVTGPVHQGDRIAVHGSVRHTGNLVVHGLRGADADALDCADRTLQPGGATTCDGAFHIVTAADVRAGVVRFTTEVEGRVSRADGGSEHVGGGSGTTQTGAVTADHRTGRSTPAEDAWPVTVASPVRHDEVRVEAPAAAGAAGIPAALAFTGTTAVAGGLVGALGLVLLGTALVVVRRRADRTEPSAQGVTGDGGAGHGEE